MNKVVKKHKQEQRQQESKSQQSSEQVTLTPNIVEIVMTNGERFHVKMCVPEPCTKHLSIDAHSHRAWHGDTNKVRASQVQKFQDKFNKRK